MKKYISLFILSNILLFGNSVFAENKFKTFTDDTLNISFDYPVLSDLQINNKIISENKGKILNISFYRGNKQDEMNYDNTIVLTVIISKVNVKPNIKINSLQSELFPDKQEIKHNGENIGYIQYDKNTKIFDRIMIINGFYIQTSGTKTSEEIVQNLISTFKSKEINGITWGDIIKNGFIDESYKVISRNGQELYYWIYEGGIKDPVLGYIVYNGRKHELFSKIDEVLITNDGRLGFMQEIGNNLKIILDGEIIFEGNPKELQPIEQKENVLNFYINEKKYTVGLHKLREMENNDLMILEMTNEDFEVLQKRGFLGQDNKVNSNISQNNSTQSNNIDNSQNETIETPNKTTQTKERTKFLKQKILSASALKKVKQEKYITQIDKLVEKRDNKKLNQVFDKIQKLKKKNAIIDYLEAKIGLKINENINIQELNINIEQKNNEVSLVKEAQDFDKTNNVNRIYGDEKDNILKGIDIKRNIIWGKEGKDGIYGGKLDDIIIVVGDMSKYGKSDTKQTLEFLGFKIEEINGKNFNISGSPKVIDGGEGHDILFVTGDIDLSKTDISGIEEVIIH